MLFQIPGLCPIPGKCQNLMGSYICSCPPGYELDNTKRKCVGKCFKENRSILLIICNNDIVRFTRRQRMCGDEEHLWKWQMYKHRGRSNLRMSWRIQIERKREFDDLHWCSGGTLLWSLSKRTMLLASGRRNDEKTLLLYYGKSLGW